MKNQKWKQTSLLGIGVTAGLLLGFNLSALAQRESLSPLPLADIRALTEVFGRIKQSYVDPVEDKKLLVGAVRGMLSDLDPHSNYLDPEENKEFNSGIRGEFGGLGMEVGYEEGQVKVISPIEDTPASRAGIRANDVIISIDSVSTKGMTLNDAVRKLRGKANTSVKLVVFRKATNSTIDFNLKRETIRTQSVKVKIVDPGYAWLRITQFQERTTDDLARTLERVYRESKGDLKGLVLDLRNNPGGLLFSSIGVSAAFLPIDSLVVSSVGRDAGSRHEYKASVEEYVPARGEDLIGTLVPPVFKTLPMVVLVNDGSASASEIVAGALQDHKRAILLGVTTFGKGSVQTKIDLSNGAAMKITTARYYTPSGRSIQAKGIVPDWTVNETEVGDRSGARMREVDLEKHLNNDQQPAVTTPNTPPTSDKVSPPGTPSSSTSSPSATPPTAAKKPSERIEPGSAEDFQFQQALNVLRKQEVKGIYNPPEPPATAGKKIS